MKKVVWFEFSSGGFPCDIKNNFLYDVRYDYPEDFGLFSRRLYSEWKVIWTSFKTSSMSSYTDIEEEIY